MQGEVDAVVAGAGAVGLSVARRLAAQGARVAVFDPYSRGGRGSRAAAGVAIPSLRISGDAPLVALAREGLRELANDVDELQRRPGELRRGSGIVRLAWDESERAELERVSNAETLGTWITAAELEELEPALARTPVAGGFSNPSGEVVDADAYVTALLHDAARRGVDVRLGEAIRAVETGRPGLVVHTSHGRVESQSLVVAAGAWSGKIEGLPALDVRPVRGQMLELLASDHSVDRVVSGRLYLAPGRSGRIVVGATEEEAGFAEETTAEGLLLLTSFVARVAPELAKASVTASWAGLRAVTGSGRPLVGRLDDSGRLFAATGHGGQGILTAALTGAIVAEAMQGRRHELLAELEPRS